MTDRTIAAALRRLNREEFAGFVADLWTARGRSVERDGRLLRVGEDRRAIAPVPASRLPASFRSVPEGAEAVVTPDPSAFADAGVEVVGPEEVVSMLRYGVSPETGARLGREHLGAAPGELRPPPSVRARRAVAALPLRRASAALALACLLAALVLTLPAVPASEPASGGATADRPAANDTGVETTEPDPDEGGYSAAALVAAHRSALNGTEYRYTVTTVRSSPGEDDPRVSSRRGTVDGERALLRVRGIGERSPIADRTVYHDGTATFRAVSRNDTVRYERVPGGPDPVNGSLAALERHLSTGDLAGRDVFMENGGRRSLIVGNEAPPGVDATSYTVRVQRGEEGYIHRVNVEYARPDGGQTSVTWVFWPVEESSLEAPQWYVLMRSFE
jgi:hypothetical protein